MLNFEYFYIIKNLQFLSIENIQEEREERKILQTDKIPHL